MIREMPLKEQPLLMFSDINGTCGTRERIGHFLGHTGRQTLYDIMAIYIGVYAAIIGIVV